MTTVNPFLSTSAPEQKPGGDLSSVGTLEPGGRWKRADELLDRFSEWLNPILVKEARQALKSKQFLLTFTTLLILCAGWSLLGITLSSPGVQYNPAGAFMLNGYLVVLALPILVIVPFVAFRSLSAELEDGTYELLSISALTSRQIVTGKLGSAVLQMLVYYSAISPCIAFTYLLRGVDVPSIVMILVYGALASFLLATIGLLMATASRSRHFQIFLSVVLLAGLFVAAITITSGGIGILQFGVPYDVPEFWIANLVMLTFYLSFVVLFIYAAAGQITFASENRTTRLRVVMLVQQLLWTGWMTYFLVQERIDELFYFTFIITGIYWTIMGALMIGETAQISPRARRDLPQSFLGRAAFTWFNPGSGTGYVFAVANILGLTAVISAVGLSLRDRSVGRMSLDYEWLCFGLLVVGYVVAYLGIARIMLFVLDKFVQRSLLLSVLIATLCIAAGPAIPWFVELGLSDFWTPSYSGAQASNWIWTLYYSASTGLLTTGHEYVLILVLGAAVLVLVVNFALTAREIAAVRLATPERVLEDEWILHPEKAPKPQVASSPWDNPND